MLSRTTTLFLVTGVLLITAGCSQVETPAVCSSVISLKASVADVTTVDIEQGALAELKDNLTQVQTDRGKVKDDAKDQYATEIDAVEEASASVSTSVDAATALPSAAAITDVGTAIQALGTSLTTLADAVESTC